MMCLIASSRTCLTCYWIRSGTMSMEFFTLIRLGRRNGNDLGRAYL